jgi:hypothetical protein
MEKAKSDGEVVAEIYRNASLGLESISDILPEIEDDGIRDEVMREHEGYEEICSEAASLALKYDIDVKEPGAMKKAMMWSAIKMNAGGDNSQSNIAQMMIRGTVTGITSLKATYSESEEVLDDEVKKLLAKLINMEESYEKRLKKYL